MILIAFVKTWLSLKDSEKRVDYLARQLQTNAYLLQRASSELKAQDTRSTKRPTTMKGTEPIGNRKALTATSTTTKKSADVVDSAILENGLHLRDQTAETKYDNDSPTKKSDALVVDLDEQPAKENDAPLPRKPLLRKQSTEVSTYLLIDYAK